MEVYADTQPEKAQRVNYRDGQPSTKIRFTPCLKRDVGERTRARKEKYQYQITLGT